MLVGEYFVMHWFLSTTPDFTNIFRCFGCRCESVFTCFSVACEAKPVVHYFCRACAHRQDQRQDFACPACLLRVEVDNAKTEIVGKIVEATARRRDVREIGEARRVRVDRYGFVHIYRDDVRRYGHHQH